MVAIGYIGEIISRNISIYLLLVAIGIIRANTSLNIFQHCLTMSCTSSAIRRSRIAELHLLQRVTPESS